MEYIYLGKIVSTHGIKGEIKIISDFQYKEKAFLVNNKIYIGKNHTEEVIKSYRKHKNYDMVTLSDYKNINEVLPFIREDVYILKSDLRLDNKEILDNDLIGFELIVNDTVIGIIKEVFMPSKFNKVIRFSNLDKNYVIPYNMKLIKEIEKTKKQMILYSKEGVFECE